MNLDTFHGAQTRLGRMAFFAMLMLVAAQQTAHAQPPSDSQPPRAGADDSEQPMPDSTTAATQPPSTTRPFTRRSTRTNQLAGYRLASIPKMFGDLFGGGGRFITPLPPNNNLPEPFLETDLPLASVLRRSKISENNNVLPTNRVFFMYNHFSDALARAGTAPGPQMSDIDVYTVGIEKMFCDAGSVELRMPFMTSYQSAIVGRGVSGGSVGNLSLIVKHLVGVHEDWVWGGGLAIDFPTGSPVDLQVDADSFELKNDAVHFLPFLAASGLLTDTLFWNASAQVDLASGGNRVTGATLPANLRYNVQNVFYADAAAGYWFRRDVSAPHVTGIAGIAELHYTSAMQDTDTVAFAQGVLTNPDNRFDVLNMSAGLHFELHGHTTLRVLAVAPLRSGDDRRFFDAEFSVQLTRYY